MIERARTRKADVSVFRLERLLCSQLHNPPVVFADRHKRENMLEGAVSLIKHFQGVALN